MSENAENTTYHQPTLFAEDFHASLTVLPGSAGARKTTVTSGRNIAGLLQNADPVGLLVKMCLESEQPYSTRCYLTWKVSTTPLGRLLFRLAPSTPRTGGNESLLLPTPATVDSGSYFNTSIGSENHRPTLGAMAKYNLWPTPQSTDWKRDGRAHGFDQIDLPRIVGGLLNPQWVEWLMGFPDGWTDLEHSETP